MTPSLRAQLRAVNAQVAALKEQAVALSMQADTLERTFQALVEASPAEADDRALRPLPPPVRHFNMPPANVTGQHPTTNHDPGTSAP